MNVWREAVGRLCPEDEDWAGYVNGAIAPGELRTAMEEHLLECARCREVHQDAVSFFGPGPETVDPAVTEAARLAVRARAVKRRRPAPFDWRWGAIAAAVLATAGQWFSLHSQRVQWASERTSLMTRIDGLRDEVAKSGRQLALAREPAMNAPIVDLRPAGAILRSGGGDALAAVRGISPSQPLTLILNGPPGRRVQLELRGPEALTLAGAYDGDGVLVAAIPAGRLPAGVYAVTLIDGAQRQRLAPDVAVQAR